MVRLGTVALGVLSLALAGSIALELRGGKSTDSQPVQARPSSAAEIDGKTVVPSNQDKIWAEVGLARPIFSPSRRPPSIMRAAQKGPTQAKLPRLAGIVVDGARRSVIFAPEGDRKPIVVAEGGEFDGFKVEQIEAGRVTVTGGSGGRQVLRPSFNPNAPSPPALPVAAALPSAQPQAPAFNGPPGLDRMPALVSAGQGPVTPTLPGLPSLSGLTGIPGLSPPER